MQTVMDAGIRMILFLQSLGSWLAEPMKSISLLGNEEFYLLVAPIFYWCIDARLGLRLGIILMFSAGINNVLKLVFHSPRPYWVDPQVSAWRAEPSFGLPSAHSQNAVAVWGLLAIYYGRSAAWALAIALIFLIGLSRMVLGVHFPTDVVTGWLVGGLVLWAFLKLEEPVKIWLLRHTPGAQILAALGTSLALILLGGLAQLSLRGWTVPGEWIQNAMAATGIAHSMTPLALSGLVSDAGALFGLAAGAILASLYGGFDAGGPLLKRVLRFLIGVAGVLLIWRGLGAVLPRGENLTALILRYLRYVLIGGWISGIAPMLFTRASLADKTAGRKGAEVRQGELQVSR
jgi:membrane-associated phospholipid phosphatase